MPTIGKLTVQEAGFVLNRPSKTLNRAIDRDILVKKKSASGQRLLGHAELRYLCLATELEKSLTPQGRRRIYTAIKGLPRGSHRLAFGPLNLEFEAIDKTLDARVDRLSAIRNVVEHKAGREPLLKGTTIPVHVIAALARGQSSAEIREDYPSLSDDQVQAAIDYASVYPKPGRPYPERSLKRMLAGAAAVGVFDPTPDAGNEDEPLSPALFG